MSDIAIKSAKAKLVEKQNLLKQVKEKLKKVEQEVKSAAKEYKLQVRIQRTQGIKTIRGTQEKRRPSGYLRKEVVAKTQKIEVKGTPDNNGNIF